MKLWIDDVRPAPEGYVWCKSVNTAKKWILGIEDKIKHYNFQLEKTVVNDRDLLKKEIIDNTIILIDVDHDAGDFACDGGDYIRLLDWLEETGRNYPIRIHSANPVGVQNMRRIIQRNGWKEVR